jgi:pimeloyl-ACP methyl ester carboxylesterase
LAQRIFPYLYQERPDPNDDPLSSNTSTAWDVHREMWDSHGEFVVDGNLTEVEYLDKLSQIKVPTLIIAGDHDESVPKVSRQMHDNIGGSQLVILRVRRPAGTIPAGSGNFLALPPSLLSR